MTDAQGVDTTVIPDSEDPQPGGSATHPPLLQVADQQANHFSQVQTIKLSGGISRDIALRFEVLCNLPGLDDLVGRFENIEQVEAWKQALLEQHEKACMR